MRSYFSIDAAAEGREWNQPSRDDLRREYARNQAIQNEETPQNSHKTLKIILIVVAITAAIWLIRKYS